MGFAQVMRDSMASRNDDKAAKYMLPEEELTSITDTMKHNAQHLSRMVMMLFDSSDSGFAQELMAHRNELVSCNEVAQESINYTKENFPRLAISFDNELTDDVCIHSSPLYLMRTLRELLYNAAKYSDGEHVSLRLAQTEDKVMFIVEDKGPGLPEEFSDGLFKPFVKVNDLSEGLGLGLPLAKRHATALGGDLTLDTTYQEGCRFILELPKL
jgi:signal transduction histidine kinase